MTISPGGGENIVWRLRLTSTRERAFDAWLNPVDHARYWCERSEPVPEGFRLHFIDGTVEDCTLAEIAAPARLAFRYFGSRVEIDLERLDDGTDLTLTAHDVPAGDWHDVYAGWLNVLLPFKAWVDFGIDLRNHDPKRTWRTRYVDQ